MDIVLRTNPRTEPSVDSGKESGYGRVMPSRSRSTEFRKQTSNSDDSENESTTSSQYGSRGFRRSDSNETTDQDFPSTNGMKQPLVSSEGNIVDLKNIRNKKMLPTPPTETPTNYQYEHCMPILITFSYFHKTNSMYVILCLCVFGLGIKFIQLVPIEFFIILT